MDFWIIWYYYAIDINLLANLLHILITIHRQRVKRPRVKRHRVKRQRVCPLFVKTLRWQFKYLTVIILNRLYALAIERWLSTKTKTKRIFLKFMFYIIFLERNWFLVTNSNFLILIILQPMGHDGANLWYFKLRLFDLTEFIV